MNKHTPGPWNDGSTISLCGCHHVGLNIGFLGTTSSKRYEEGLANARLIAAAPDLVIELRQAVIQMEMAAESIEKGRYDEALLHVSSLMRSKKEVLAKATGESA